MKKRVGMLYGKPIIVGDKNLQNINEIYLNTDNSNSSSSSGCSTNQENVMYIEEIQGDCYVDGIKVNDIIYNPIGFGTLIDANVYRKIKDNNITNFVYIGYHEGTDKVICKSLNYREYSSDGHIEFWYMDFDGKEALFSIYEFEPEM